MSKDLAYFMALPYGFILTPDPDAGGFVIGVQELPGCLSQGETPAEAMSRIREAMEAWIQSCIDDGKPVPEPGAPPAEDFSGKFGVRVPKSVHRALAAAAEREGVSMNLFVATTLAAAVGRKVAG